MVADRAGMLARYARDAPVRYRDEYLPVDGGRLLATRFWADGTDPGARPGLFVPGWASAVRSWSRVIPPLCSAGPVLLVETREKPGSVLAPGAGQGLDAVFADLSPVVARERPRWLAGASTGANLVAELAGTSPDGTPVVMILPHYRVPVPAVVPALRFLPTRAFEALGGFAVDLMRPFAMSAVEKRQQSSLFEALDAGQLKVLVRSVTAWRHYRPSATAVRTLGRRQVLLVTADGDRFHERRQGAWWIERTGAQELHCPDYARAHDAEVGQYLAGWLERACAAQDDGSPAGGAD